MEITRQRIIKKGWDLVNHTEMYDCYIKGKIRVHFNNLSQDMAFVSVGSLKKGYDINCITCSGIRDMKDLNTLNRLVNSYDFQ